LNQDFGLVLLEDLAKVWQELIILLLFKVGVEAEVKGNSD
jgi:hypothetical protein